MKLFRGSRALVSAIGAGALVLVWGVVPAQARPVEQDHFHDVGSELLTDCEGITLQHDFDVEGSFLLNSRGPDGLLYGRDSVHGTETFTNVANGMTLTGKFAGSGHDLTVTDNGDGTFTIFAQSTFMNQYRWPDGTVFHDSGQVRFELLIDTKGTEDPSDDTDEFLGVVRVTGRSDTEGRDFCADVLEFLG